MHKFKRDILQINFEPYFYILIKYIITYQVFHKQAIFPRVSSPYGHKSLSYLGCKLWEELPDNQKNIKLNLYIPLVKLMVFVYYNIETLDLGV